MVTSPEPVQVVRVTKKSAYLILKRPGADIDQAAVDMLSVALAAKQPRDGDVKAFSRHLFQVLIGDPLWDQVAPAPGRTRLSSRAPP